MKKELADFRQRINKLWIVYDQVKNTWAVFDSIRAYNRSRDESSLRHCFVFGPSGSGKTQIAVRYREKNSGYTETREDGTEVDIKPVIYLELPHPFTIAEFYQSIITALGAPNMPAGTKIGVLKRQVFTLLEAQKIEMIFLDEMDAILTSPTIPDATAMGTIKHVANTGRVSLVLIGTPGTETLRKLNFQNYRRYPATVLKPFENYDTYFKFLSEVEKQLKPPKPTGLAVEETGIPQFLWEVSSGLVGPTINIIVDIFNVTGVLKDDNYDFSRFIIDEKVLEKAYRNVFGDITPDEMKRMMEKD